uniref:Uncharacterized protein n=1 Tax=Anopheles albimanus TaxID=7167 RepID=A0A182F1J1_ANOAL
MSNRSSASVSGRSLISLCLNIRNRLSSPTAAAFSRYQFDELLRLRAWNKDRWDHLECQITEIPLPDNVLQGHSGQPALAQLLDPAHLPLAERRVLVIAYIARPGKFEHVRYDVGDGRFRFGDVFRLKPL